MSNRMATLLWFLLGVSMTVAVVLGVVLLTGDDDGTAVTTIPATTTVAPTTTSPGEASTTTAPASTTTAPASTTTAAPACAGLPSATIPTAGPGVTTVLGDFDADGAMDQLIGYQKSNGTFWVQIALSYGYATEIEAMDRAEALAAQAFAPGDAWLGLAATGSGASTDVIQWFLLDGCAIAGATIDGTFESSFIRGGSVTHGDGILCRATGFTSTSVETTDGTNWEYRTADYEWDPVARTFESQGLASSTLIYPADEDVIFGAYQLACPYSP